MGGGNNYNIMPWRSGMQIHAKPVCRDLHGNDTGRVDGVSIRERVRDRVCFRHDMVIASITLASSRYVCQLLLSDADLTCVRRRPWINSITSTHTQTRFAWHARQPYYCDACCDNLTPPRLPSRRGIAARKKKLKKAFLFVPFLTTHFTSTV